MPVPIKIGLLSVGYKRTRMTFCNHCGKRNVIKVQHLFNENISTTH
jgi:hypothetical protein